MVLAEGVIPVTELKYMQLSGVTLMATQIGFASQTAWQLPAREEAVT